MEGKVSNEVGGQLATSDSTEDLSEYTDADESISAPTEFLAEFLSAVMLKDYQTALKYCKLILQYEPNNATAKEFYPLIVEKLEICDDEQDSDSESASSDSESSSSSSSHSSCSGCGSGSVSGGDGELTKPTDSDGTTASYSSLEDEEPDRENNALRHSRKYSSTDFTNGNTACTKERLVAAIQRKLEDNRRAARVPLKHRLQSLTRNMARTSLSGERRTSVDRIATGTVESPDSPEGGDFEKTVWAGGLNLKGCAKRYSRWEKSSGDEEAVDLVGGTGCDAWGETSPGSEGSLGFPFSSDSSPTDPHSVLTVQSPVSNNNV